MTPHGPPASSLPPKETGPSPVVVAVIGVLIIAVLVAVFLADAFRGSPKTVTTALHGAKKDYVGAWSTKGTGLSASLDIAATGVISYYESEPLRASRGERGDYEAGPSDITAFEGDDIVAGQSLRIKVTSRPHVVGDHLEMTANGLRFVRNR
jgi:hypothetical protein